MEFLNSNARSGYPLASTAALTTDMASWYASTYLVGSTRMTSKLPAGLIVDAQAACNFPLARVQITRIQFSTSTLTWQWRLSLYRTNSESSSWLCSIGGNIASSYLPLVFVPAVTPPPGAPVTGGFVSLKFVVDGAILNQLRTMATSGGKGSSYNISISPSDLTLLPSTIIPLQRVRPSVRFSVVEPLARRDFSNVVAGPSSGNVRWSAGYNSVLSQPVPGTIRVDAAEGAGLGKAPCDVSSNNAPKGISVGEDGNLDIVTDSCHSVLPHVPSQQLLLFGNCDSCCSCSDYANFFKALKKSGEKWGLTWDMLDTYSARYNTTKTKYDRLRKQEEAVTATMTGAVARAAYIEDLSGYPQWMLDNTRTQDQRAFPFTASITLIVHNPTPEWGNLTSRKWLKNLKFDVGPGSFAQLDLSRVRVSTSATTLSTTQTDTKSGIANGVLAATVTQVDGAHHVITFPEDYGTESKFYLNPCYTFEMQLHGTMLVNRNVTARDPAHLYVTATWDLQIEGDANLDGLPDFADAALKAGGKVLHTKTKSVILAFD